MSRFEKVLLYVIGKLEVVMLQHNVECTYLLNLYSEYQWKLYLW